jgi:hypothetical protein
MSSKVDFNLVVGILKLVTHVIVDVGNDNVFHFFLYCFILKI